jgi:hypothetical protein
MCRISVRAVDPNPGDKGVKKWKVGIHSVTGRATIDKSPFCFHGGNAGETEPFTVKCPHFGDAPLDRLSVQKEDKNGIRFVWDEKTWTSRLDEGCELLEDWHVPEDSVDVSVMILAVSMVWGL